MIALAVVAGVASSALWAMVACRYTPFGCRAAAAIAGISGAAAAAVTAGFGRGSVIVPLAVGVVCGAWVAACAVDVRLLRLPDPFTKTAAAVVAVAIIGDAAVAGDWGIAVRAGISGVAWAGFLFAVFLVAPGFGFGDVKLGLSAGLLAGWAGLVPALFGLPIGIGVAAVTAIVRRGVGGTGDLPFGPGIVSGAVLAVAASSWLAAMSGAPI